jgi:pimeloyl-ACP methyl ester carboxylesterase
MPENATSKPTLLIPVRADADLAAAGKPLPAILQTGSRGGVGTPDPFLANVVVEQSYPLAAVGRGETAKPAKIEDSRKLLALEAADGTTVFIRTDRLLEELERLCPDAVGKDGIDLARFGDREATTRGGIGWPWSKLSVISLGKDAIIDTARDKALEWAQDWLGEKVQEAAEAGASWLGAKALMWAIESQLVGKPGLYQWNGGELAASDRSDKDDPKLVSAAKEGPLLIFIHGTGSHTLGAFKDLRATAVAVDWEPLAGRFGERVFGLEHRTFSESPIDNALALAEAIPAGARLSLVTHSRGGLVGDLLCLGALDDALINAYRREAPVNEKETDWQKRVREKVAAEEQRKLRELRRLLDTKRFQIERYVRVAAPARGTALLSDNLDVFLSGFLSLTSSLVGALTGPAGSAVMSAFKRIVLEIADKRVDARLVPGIEAMLTDSPLGVLLAQAPRRQGVAMAVITGDIEGGGILKRLGVMFTDWMFFDRADNDLVVDTASMYAGLARTSETRYLYDQGAFVNHFSYFDNRITRTALRDWLTVATPADLPAFDLLEEGREPTSIEAREKARGRATTRGTVAPDSRPVVILLPGIMGSHLERRGAAQKAGDGDRVWFDVPDLIAGGLGEIRFGGPSVREESLFEMFYGRLRDHLEASHAVIPFPYDWRQPIQDTGDKLAEVVRNALDKNPNQPVRLLAHSMGGLVARAMIAKHADVWKDLTARAGGRFIMLATPNNGSHLMVETLLGKSDTVRHLARLDLRHRMQGVLNIIAGFPGALQLLPRPGFQDSGGEHQEDNYFSATLWPRYRATNRDRWFGNGLVGAPAQEVLDQAAALWKDNVLGKANTVPDPDHVAYVFGLAENTPCGIRVEGGRLKMVGTSEGDGSVTWASGRLENLPPERCWHMPVAHGDLANSEEHLPAILDLLQTGETSRLGRLPVSRGVAATRSYDAGPAPYPTEEELTRSLLGAKPQRRKARIARQRLTVRVVAGDLRHIQLPVMCGHYFGDPIAGAEYHIDQHVVDRALSQRERLGLYASEIGTSVVVLNPRSEEDVRRGTGRGAVIIGLGEFGKLSASSVTETVRAGVLRFLLHTHDCRSGAVQAPDEVGLASLLIGYNSTANISVEDAVSAVVRGVCEANRQFEDAMGPKLRVARLDLVELFLDNAITAANAVRDLPKRQERDLQRLGVTLEAADRLIEGEGVRIRLSATSSFGYWPRLMVTGDDRKEGHARSRTELAKRLKYVFLAERARADAVVHQRQPGLIEALVKNAIHQENFNPDLAHTLFQFMVPLDFKAAVRDTERLVLMLDGYTANLPWEMLQADDQPMVLKTRLVRQLVSTRFRQVVRPSTSKTACIITDPSTDGFKEAFGKEQPLPQLPNAAKEADSVRDLLTAANYQVEFVPSGSMALDVMARLFKRAYRILMIAAHGEFELTARDGSKRSGVVLSDGIVLTAAEVGQLEVVPDLVFLNCCHLAKVDAVPASNRLADSHRLAYN